MQTIVINPHSFCEGVVLAIAEAAKAKKEHPNAPITILGSLVHNEAIIEDLTHQGFRFADESVHPLKESLLALPRGSVIVFSAHGHDPKLDELAKERGLLVYNAVCRYVKENEKAIVSELGKGHQVIYVGKKGHAEAIGALSLSEKAMALFDPSLPEEKGWQRLKDPSPAVICQTTMDEEDFAKAKESIAPFFPQARYADLRCESTKSRQRAVLSAPKDIDLYVIMGSKTSNNTMKLFGLAKAAFPEADVLRVLSLAELKAYPLAGKKKAALASGASTSPKDFSEVEAYLKSL